MNIWRVSNPQQIFDEEKSFEQQNMNFEIVSWIFYFKSLFDKRTTKITDLNSCRYFKYWKEEKNSTFCKE